MAKKHSVSFLFVWCAVQWGMQSEQIVNLNNDGIDISKKSKVSANVLCHCTANAPIIEI